MKAQEILNILHEAAASPKKQLDKYLAENKKVVAIAPVYTPEEIIHSMGLVPIGVWGADMEVREAKTYYPAFICSIMQTVLELGINGKYKGISAIVIPSLCDSLKTLGQNWKYAVKDIPFIPMTYPQNRKPDYGIKFTKSSYERLIKDLEEITGARFSEENLKKSNQIYNEHNAVMREFAETAAVRKISAAGRNDVFKSAWFMLKEEHTALVKDLIAELKNEAEDKSDSKVYVTGILADSPNLLEIFDKNGLKVVADDVAHESRQYKTDIPQMESSLDALANKFANMDNCTLLYDRDKKRVDYIIDEAKKHNAKGVIVLMTKFCDPEEFDYVPIKRACDKAGLAHINIEVDRQMVNYQQAGTMLQAFKEML
jgi:benzoyl-coA reductase